jgi:hypothetical protein
VRAKHSAPVGGISVRPAAPWMVWREAEGVEVLVDRDDREEGVVVPVHWSRKSGFGRGACGLQWVRRLEVKFAWKCRGDVGWGIGPLVCFEDAPVYR